MTKLTIAPVASSYSAQDGEETIAIQLDGGKSRYHLDIANAWSTVNVTWITNKFGFKYLRAFYNVATDSGSLPFTVDLVLDDYEPLEHSAYFVPNTLALNSIQGDTYTLSAQLEVEPRDLTGNEADYVAFFGDMLPNPFYTESLFNQIINVDFADALE